MGLRIRYAAIEPGLPLGYSIERLRDGLWYDFAATGPTAGTFQAKPVQPIQAFQTGPYPAYYGTMVFPTPSNIFTDGNYCVTVHNMHPTAGNAAMACLPAVMVAGDDGPAQPIGNGGGNTITFPTTITVTIPAQTVTGKLT